MKVLATTAHVHCTDGTGERRYQQLFGAPAISEFDIEGWDIRVAVFPGISVLSGPEEAMAHVSHLRGTVFVDSLADAEPFLHAAGWTTAGPLGSGPSLLARDPDGKVLEFVEQGSPK